MDIERIEELMQKASLAVDERKEITDAATAEGINYKIKKGKFCGQCYEKILLKLFERKASSVESNVSVDGYRLRDIRKRLIIGGVLVNNETIASVEVGKFSDLVRNRFFVK